MWRFHRYYLRELLLNFGMTFAVLFGIALLALLARGITRTQGQDMLLALWVTLLWTLELVPDLIAISTLIASVLTFSRAAAENEIIAIRMAGIRPGRLIGSVVIVGALTASVNTYLVHDLIPQVHFLKYRPVQDLATLFLMNLRPSNNRIEFGDRLTMTWQRHEEGRYVDVTLKASGTDLSYEGFARRVWFERDESGRRLFLKLQGPESHSTNTSGTHVEEAQRTVVRWTKDAVITVTFDLQELTQQGLRSEGIRDIPTTQLVAENERFGSENLGVSRWEVYSRSFRGLTSLLFALAAFPIGVLARRSSRMAALGLSAVPLTVYYGSFYAAPALARGTGTLWPVTLPTLALLLLTWTMMRRAFRV